MEVGKLKTNSTPIFYFIIDAASPDQPSASRLTHYFVTTEVDSYVEAFNFLCRSLSNTANEGNLRKWHRLYNRLFGKIEFDDFMKNVQSLPIQHFRLDTTEGAARSRLTAAKAAEPQTRRVPESNLLVYPTRSDTSGDAEIEMHRIKAELMEVESSLRLERSRKQVNALSDAERSALMYQLEGAKREADAERQKTKEATERMHKLSATLQERLEKLVDDHEYVLRERTANEHRQLQELQDQFLEREADLRRKFEEALDDRDKKLHTVTGDLQRTSLQLRDVQGQLEYSQHEGERLTSQVAALTSDIDAAREQLRRTQNEATNFEDQLKDRDNDLQRANSTMAELERQVAHLKGESRMYKAEAGRLGNFAASMHTELRQLDDSTAVASELFRRKMLNEANDRSRSFGYSTSHQFQL